MFNRIMKTFSAPNGREVSETVTDSGVTGVMDTTIPQPALKGWREQLLRRMASDAHARHIEEIAAIDRLRET
ncbi:hypothetical protein K6V18_23805 [Ralstonia insidiosa]|uniref:hypothetical protein n=1 Tax=Ralstonia TaxID=48736 RepID=UPI00066AF110|nr:MULTISPECIES: hypothetical protein [Ralstonia]MBY4708066.1 hypothetical protein [Ralstonia insidiosa]GAQ26563.1 hypothetical protein SAMD00023378_0246 [Ralstonia sp. NT80]